MSALKGWTRGYLGKICSIEIGRTPSRDIAHYWDPEKQSDNAWVTIKDMNCRFITKTAEHISDLGVKRSNSRLQPNGTILLSYKLTIGRVAIAARPLYTNEAIASLKPREFNPDFLFYGLQYWNLLQDVDQAIKGVTLNKEKLKKISFDYPSSTTEQFKIAEILMTLDRMIEQTEALIANQQRIKTGLMQDLLTRGIDNDGNIRSEKTHEFLDSPLGRIPADWECRLLAYFVPSAEYGISSSLGESGIPVLRMNNFSDGEADISNLKFTEFAVPERLLLRDGDVLFNRTNSWEHVGRTGIWRCQIPQTTFASYLVRLNPDPKKLLGELLNTWLNWEPTQIAMRRLATPAVQQVNINPTNLRSIYAAFPCSLTEQFEIVSRLTIMRHNLNSCREQLNKLRAIKTGLMQDLLTGKVPVTPLLNKAETPA
jgi:type I restriction enzyme, S subunit